MKFDLCQLQSSAAVSIKLLTLSNIDYFFQLILHELLTYYTTARPNRKSEVCMHGLKPFSITEVSIYILWIQRLEEHCLYAEFIHTKYDVLKVSSSHMVDKLECIENGVKLHLIKIHGRKCLTEQSCNLNYDMLENVM